MFNKQSTDWELIASQDYEYSDTELCSVENVEGLKREKSRNAFEKLLQYMWPPTDYYVYRFTDTYVNRDDDRSIVVKRWSMYRALNNEATTD